MIKYRRLRLLSYLVIAYMLMAFSWWSVLLFTKNSDAFLAKTELLRIGMVAEDLYVDEAQFRQTSAYLDFAAKYRRQEWMILGEALVFIITLIIGVWFINRGYKKEMEAAQQRRNFLLSITHELKSPISSIRLILDTFAKRKLQPAQAEKLVDSGLQEAERLNQLVNNLLLSARLETAFKPVFEQINLPALFEEILAQIKPKFPEAQINTQIPNDLPLLEADRDGLVSILINLVENAVKYSDPPARIQINCQRSGQFFLLEVSDQGIGISDPEKKRIFTQFYRIGNEDTRKTKGTGLGLYIVYQIVKAHRGQIKVLNNIPQGSTFRIQFPWKQ